MAIVAPYLPYDCLRVVAADFLRQHHPAGGLPVPIEDIAEFGFKVDIVPMPGLMDNFDVDAFLTSDLQEIRVDQTIQRSRPNRYRFSLAHELAHLVIHRDIFAALRYSDVRQWKEAMASIPESQYRFIEIQAYALAGLILVPERPLADMVADRAEAAAKAGIKFAEIDMRNRKIIESNIGKSFEVSQEVIARRMEKDNLWR
jgi:hypothetical protein